VLRRLARSTGFEPPLLRVMGVVLIGLVLVSLDSTMVNIAFERLGREFDAPIADLQWVTTAYVLALACLMPVTGWLARRIGPRRLYLLAISTFTVGSVLSGLAWSVGSLVGFRVLQGVGGGLLIPTGQMIMARTAGPGRMGRAMGLVTSSIVFAPILGPPLGGLIVDTASWRWIFLLNLPIGLLAVALGVRYLPRTVDPRPARFDVLGFALLAVGLPTVTYGLSRMGEEGRVTDPGSLIALGVGLALVAAFVPHARRHPHPLLALAVFRVPSFSAAALTLFVLGTSQMTAIVLTPLYFQEVRGTSALTAGLLYAPLAVGIGVAASFSGRLTDRVGGGRVAIVGISLMVAGGIPMALLGPDTSFVAICTALFVRGLGLGAGTTPVMAAAYRRLDVDQVTHAAPQLTMIQRTGSALGLAVFAAVLHQSLVGATDLSSTADAYASTFRWVLLATALPILPALHLAVVERRRPPVGDVPAVGPVVEPAG
jgi:EmrB/QacA subfamily drug resistance transporter